jgi:hypothetical protein
VLALLALLLGPGAACAVELVGVARRWLAGPREGVDVRAEVRVATDTRGDCQATISGFGQAYAFAVNVLVF